MKVSTSLSISNAWYVLSAVVRRLRQGLTTRGSARLVRMSGRSHSITLLKATATAARIGMNTRGSPGENARPFAHNVLLNSAARN